MVWRSVQLSLRNCTAVGCYCSLSAMAAIPPWAGNGLVGEMLRGESLAPTIPGFRGTRMDLLRSTFAQPPMAVAEPLVGEELIEDDCDLKVFFSVKRRRVGCRIEDTEARRKLIAALLVIIMMGPALSEHSSRGRRSLRASTLSGLSLQRNELGPWQRVSAV